MPLKTVGLLSPDMGHIVGNVLVTHGLRVITCLQGRSERTRTLAEKATYHVLVNEAEIILSIMVPAEAKKRLKRLGRLAETDTDLTYVCNAIAPQTTLKGTRCVNYRSPTQKTGGDPLLRLRDPRR